MFSLSHRPSVGAARRPLCRVLWFAFLICLGLSGRAHALSASVAGSETVTGAAGEGTSKSYSISSSDAPVSTSECTVTGGGTPGPWSGPSYSWDDPVVSDDTGVSAQVRSNSQHSQSATLDISFLRAGDYTISLTGRVSYTSNCGDDGGSDTKIISVHVGSSQTSEPINLSLEDATPDDAGGANFAAQNTVPGQTPGLPPGAGQGGAAGTDQGTPTGATPDATATDPNKDAGATRDATTGTDPNQGAGAAPGNGTKHLTRTVRPGQTKVFLLHGGIVPPNWSPVWFWLPNLAGNDGWDVRVYDAQTGGNDITAQITGIGGWFAPPGVETVLRIEVTLPEKATHAASKTVDLNAERRPKRDGTAHEVAKERDSAGLTLNAQDAAPLQPDVALSLLNQEDPGDYGDPSDYVGRDQVGSTGQRLDATSILGGTEAFAVEVKNQGGVPASFVFQKPVAPAGVTLRLFDALDGGAPLTIGDQGVTTPEIAPGQTLTWRLEVSVAAGAAPAPKSFSVPVRFSHEALSDQVEIATQLQSVAGVEYSLDAGETWASVPAQGVSVPQWGSIGFRALRGNSAIAWPDALNKPHWTQNGESSWGEETYLYFPDATPAGGASQTAQVECGNVISFQVRVQSEN